MNGSLHTDDALAYNGSLQFGGPLQCFGSLACVVVALGSAGGYRHNAATRIENP